MGVAHGGGERQLAHAEAAPGLEQHGVLAEVEAGAADVAAGGGRLLHGHRAVVVGLARSPG